MEGGREGFISPSEQEMKFSGGADAEPTTTLHQLAGWLHTYVLRFLHCLFIFRKGEEAPEQIETKPDGARGQDRRAPLLARCRNGLGGTEGRREGGTEGRRKDMRN